MGVPLCPRKSTSLLAKSHGREPTAESYLKVLEFWALWLSILKVLKLDMKPSVPFRKLCFACRSSGCAAPNLLLAGCNTTKPSHEAGLGGFRQADPSANSSDSCSRCRKSPAFKGQRIRSTRVAVSLVFSTGKPTHARPKILQPEPKLWNPVALDPPCFHEVTDRDYEFFQASGLSSLNMR